MPNINLNLLPSQHAAVAGVIDPDSYSTGTQTTGWIDMQTFEAIMAVVQAGDLGTSATIDAKIEQATDGSGTDAKDVSDKAITQLTQAGGDSDKQAIVNVYADDLDTEGEFTHVRLSLSVGTASSDASALVLGFYPHYGPADEHHLASVAETL